MLEALRQVNKWTPRKIQIYCKELCSEIIGQLREEEFQIEDEAWRGHHMFGIRLPKRIDMNSLRRHLSEKNVHVSVRGTAIRVSPHLYNNDKDIEMLRGVLLNV